MDKTIVHEDTLDILETFQDALEIVYDCDEDEFVFSETSSFRPPSYMISAAKRGLKMQYSMFSESSDEAIAGYQVANHIADGKNLSIKQIKRLRSFAQRNIEDITPSMKSDSPFAQKLLLRGVPASKTGAGRVISWANARIKEYEKACQS